MQVCSPASILKVLVQQHWTAEHNWTSQNFQQLTGESSTASLSQEETVGGSIFIWKKQNSHFNIQFIVRFWDTCSHARTFTLGINSSHTAMSVNQVPIQASIFWPRQEAKLFYPLTLKKSIQKVIQIQV